MEPRELSPSLLEALVDVVATLGELAATVTPPRRSLRPSMSLYEDLRTFTWELQNTLRHRCVTSLEHPDVTSLGQALAALGTTPGATWADVRAAFEAWQDSVEELEDSWDWLVQEAADLLDDSEDEDGAEDIAKAVATAQARDLRAQATGWGTAGDNLVAAAWQPQVALAKDKVASMAATHDVVAATEAVEETVMATSQVGAATRRQQVEEALELLERLEAACDRASALPRELQSRLRDIQATLKVTEKASADVPEALVAAVAEAERLWEASTRLTTHHLLGTLGDIRRLLFSRLYGPGGPSGPMVAERCQKAIEDIPRLLEGQ